jgi:hypothetical protein
MAGPTRTDQAEISQPAELAARGFRLPGVVAACADDPAALAEAALRGLDRVGHHCGDRDPSYGTRTPRRASASGSLSPENDLGEFRLAVSMRRSTARRSRPELRKPAPR